MVYCMDMGTQCYALVPISYGTPHSCPDNHALLVKYSTKLTTTHTDSIQHHIHPRRVYFSIYVVLNHS